MLSNLPPSSTARGSAHIEARTLIARLVVSMFGEGQKENTWMQEEVRV